ncbi:MAG: hypothetical protein R3268_11710, partial [Acidiferrobacterales bacterium]|nr:hypothetical protein [Acidiferrobacterales bacterium]
MSKHGFNDAYIDELYAVYQSNPQAVSPAWRDFFADWTPPKASSTVDPASSGSSAPVTNATASTLTSAPAATPEATHAEKKSDTNLRRLTGITGKIAENMAESV